jgi:hypothetical protein
MCILAHFPAESYRHYDFDLYVHMPGSLDKTEQSFYHSRVIRLVGRVERSIAAETRNDQSPGAGDPTQRGEFPEGGAGGRFAARSGDRALPGPSPTANLAGFWKAQ